MKNALFPLLTLIIGFAAGYYFNSAKMKEDPKLASRTLGGPYPSENSISIAEAQMMVDTFGMYGMQDKNHRPGGKGEKTRSVFFPLTKLDSLVAALDDARKKDGKTDGIRIYFGRYPKMQMDRKTPYPHPYLNTIIMVSTKLTRILQKGAKDSISIHLDYYGATNRNKPMFMLAVDPQNRNELCPDICDGATLVCPDPTDPTCTGN